MEIVDKDLSDEVLTGMSEEERDKEAILQLFRGLPKHRKNIILKLFARVLAKETSMDVFGRLLRKWRYLDSTAAA